MPPTGAPVAFRHRRRRLAPPLFAGSAVLLRVVAATAASSFAATVVADRGRGRVGRAALRGSGGCRRFARGGGRLFPLLRPALQQGTQPLLLAVVVLLAAGVCAGGSSGGGGGGLAAHLVGFGWKKGNKTLSVQVTQSGVREIRFGTLYFATTLVMLLLL